MKKIILSSALILSSSMAKIDITAGLLLGGVHEKSKIAESVTMPADNYAFGQKNKGRGFLGGINIGARTQVSKFVIGADVEVFAAQSKQATTKQLDDSVIGQSKVYKRDLRYLGGYNFGLKIGYAITEGMTIYLRPMIGLDRFETKIMYMDDITTPINNRRKNNHVIAKGIGLGLEKQAGSFLVGLEGRYVKNGTIRQTHRFFDAPQDTTTLKTKPSRYMGLIKVSYVF